ncbi:cell division protein FtsW [Arsenophonus symbiont of Ornithomya chloropus]|uniref:cell division protein FtsW n=1 Tax=Arsenophonus symbiont of Ornithomya chloropus TaxID=634121 RepID=UPI0032B3027B
MLIFNFKKLKILISSSHKNVIDIFLYDRILVWLTLILSIIGFIMVTSASVSIGERLMQDAFFFAKRDIIYLILSFVLAFLVLNVSMIWWEKYNFLFLIISIFFLLLVIIFGRSFNGASRWINFGIINIQPAEFSKLALFCYISSYLVRKIDEVKNKFLGFIKPIFILILMSILLLLEPDLGTVIILVVTTLALLFIAGAKLMSFLISITICMLTIFVLVYFEPYRFRRITSFLNPWADPFDTGYQLTQSLMAFGRGKLCGEGLGNSIQKLEYLPEAHTDFIFSVLAEELGYIGAVVVLLMLFFVVFRGMIIGKLALDIDQCFSGYLACCISIWFTCQVFLNIGATIGIVPTKGLTLPLISYGGSSLSIMIITVAILLRIDFETRIQKIQAFIRRDK